MMTDEGLYPPSIPTEEAVALAAIDMNRLVEIAPDDGPLAREIMVRLAHGDAMDDLLPVASRLGVCPSVVLAIEAADDVRYCLRDGEVVLVKVVQLKSVITTYATGENAGRTLTETHSYASHGRSIHRKVGFSCE